MAIWDEAAIRAEMERQRPRVAAQFRAYQDAHEGEWLARIQAQAGAALAGIEATAKALAGTGAASPYDVGSDPNVLGTKAWLQELEEQTRAEVEARAAQMAAAAATCAAARREEAAALAEAQAEGWRNLGRQLEARAQAWADANPVPVPPDIEG